MRRTYSCIAALLMMISCNSFSDKKDVLPPEKMQAVLNDIHIAEVYSTLVNDSLHQLRNRNNDSIALYYKSVLTHHHISLEELNKSIGWYKMNPSELDSVYADIITHFSKLESEHPIK